MRKLKTSDISTSNAFPVKSGTLQHIQAAYGEAIGEAVKGLIGAGYDSTKVYILNGCVNSGSGDNYIISAGSVFYAGEVYLVPAATFTATSPNVAVGSLNTSYFAAVNADPVEFSDGIPRNVHEINRIVIAQGLAGSGAADYNNWIDINKRLQGAIGQVIIWRYSGSLSTYFNSTGLGIHPWTTGWAIADGSNGTEDFGGLFPVGYKASDPDYDTPYSDTGGAANVTLTTDQVPSLEVEVPQGDSFTGPGGAGRVGRGSANENTFTLTTNGAGGAHENRPPYKTVLFVQRIA